MCVPVYFHIYIFIYIFPPKHSIVMSHRQPSRLNPHTTGATFRVCKSMKKSLPRPSGCSG